LININSTCRNISSYENANFFILKTNTLSCILRFITMYGLSCNTVLRNALPLSAPCFVLENTKTSDRSWFLIKWYNKFLFLFFNKIDMLFHIFSSGWNWRYGYCFRFVKTFQPVRESQLALLQKKSVCLFLIKLTHEKIFF
jgi:hypothetical protein